MAIVRVRRKVLAVVRDGGAQHLDEGVEAARREDEGEIARIAAEVRELAAAFPIPGFALPGPG